MALYLYSQFDRFLGRARVAILLAGLKEVQILANSLAELLYFLVHLALLFDLAHGGFLLHLLSHLLLFAQLLRLLAHFNTSLLPQDGLANLWVWSDNIVIVIDQTE